MVQDTRYRASSVTAFTSLLLGATSTLLQFPHSSQCCCFMFLTLVSVSESEEGCMSLDIEIPHPGPPSSLSFGQSFLSSCRPFFLGTPGVLGHVLFSLYPTPCHCRHLTDHASVNSSLEVGVKKRVAVKVNDRGLSASPVWYPVWYPGHRAPRHQIRL